MLDQTTDNAAHKIQISQRNRTVISGVRDVVSFDNKEVLLETVDGMLQFKGEGFHVKRLTLEKGEVDMEGKVDQMTYFENQEFGKSAGSFVSRLFR